MQVRRVLSLAFVPFLLALMMLGLGAPTAGAVSVDKVTGGQSSLTVPWSMFIHLLDKRITSAPIGGAYLSAGANGPTVNFPISDGTLESDTMLGTVNHPGGLRMTKYNPDFTVQSTLNITELKIVNGNTLVGNALGLVPSPAADLINATHSKNQSTGVITYAADAQINAVNALVLNTYFDTDAFQSGMILGHMESTIQTKPIH